MLRVPLQPPSISIMDACFPKRATQERIPDEEPAMTGEQLGLL
jgi:hypothetical protein